MVLLPPLLGGIRDGAGDPTLPNSAWGTLPPVCLCCRQGWPQRCTLPAACTLPAPLSPRNLRALPQAGHSPRGLSDPQCPTVLPPQAASEMLFPHSPPSLPASGSRCRAAGTGGHCSGLPCSGAGLPPLSPSSSLLGSHPWVCPGFSLMLPSSALPFPAFSCFSNLLEPLRSGFDPSAQAANWLGSKMSRVHFS